MVYEDESHFPLKPYVWREWVEKGKKVEVKFYHNNKQKVTAYAGIDLQGNITYTLEDKGNHDGFYSFLSLLAKTYRSRHYSHVYLILDRAKYHEGVLMRHNLKLLFQETGVRIKLVYLPRGSPDKNPVEGLWKLLKKAISNTLIRSASEIRYKLTHHIDNVLKGNAESLMKATQKQFQTIVTKVN